METEYFGIVIVPLIVGLVEAAKRIGMGTRWATPLAVGMGLLVALLYQVSKSFPGALPWVTAIFVGLALGLTASGLYSGVKKIGES